MNETTPDMKMLIEGQLKCLCGNIFSLYGKKTLENIKCLICGKTHLVPLKISHFWLLSQIAQGGMGSVYRAISEDGSIECAVKILPRGKQNDPFFIKGMLREINAIKAVGTHENIVKLIEAGHSDGEYFIATEYIHGERLDKYVERQFHLTERESIAIILKIIEIEKHILSKGYLYRDIKPQNIIISDKKSLKLFDFGLCLRIEDATTFNSKTDDIEGSPFYLPPERILGAAEQEYSEIYSLGMLFFFLLTGQTYYSKAEADALMKKHINAIRMVSTATFLRYCNQTTVDIIDKMLERDCSKRISNFHTLQNGLKKVRREISGTCAKTNPATKKNNSDKKTAFFKSKKIKYALTALVGIVSVSLLAISVFIAISTLKYNFMKRGIQEMVATELGIPVDIQEPQISPEKIKKMLDEKEREIFSSLKNNAPIFNEKDEIIKICEQFNINPYMRKAPTLPLYKLDEFVQKQQKLAESKGIAKEIDWTKYYRDAGYRLLNGTWLSEDQIIQSELAKAGKIYKENFKNAIIDIRRMAKEKAEKEIYIKHGYLFFQGQWKPAKEILDEMVMAEINDKKRIL